GAAPGGGAEGGGDDPDRPAALAGGERPGEPGADDAAEQRRGHREALEEPADPELLAHRVDRAVDHGGVEAEQEAAHRGRQADPEDPPVHPGGCVVRGAHLLPLWSPVPGTLTPNPTLGAGRPSLNAQTPTPKPPPTPPPRAHFFTGGRARSAPELVVPLDDRLHAAHDGGGEPGLF